MPVARDDLVAYLDDLLDVTSYEPGRSDGLLVPGRSRLRRLGAAVSASIAAIDAAEAARADLLLVHHPPFADHDPLRDDKLARLTTLGIALYAAHDSLDYAPGFGTADAVAARLGLPVEARFGAHPRTGGRAGVVCPVEGTLDDLVVRVRLALAAPVQVWRRADRVTRLGILAGFAARPAWLAEAHALGCDAFLSGEADLFGKLYAREVGLSLLLASHEATEAPAVDALGRRVADRFGLRFTFFVEPPVELPDVGA